LYTPTINPKATNKCMISYSSCILFFLLSLLIIVYFLIFVFLFRCYHFWRIKMYIIVICHILRILQNSGFRDYVGHFLRRYRAHGSGFEARLCRRSTEPGWHDRVQRRVTYILLWHPRQRIDSPDVIRNKTPLAFRHISSMFPDLLCGDGSVKLRMSIFFFCSCNTQPYWWYI